MQVNILLFSGLKKDSKIENDSSHILDSERTAKEVQLHLTGDKSGNIKPENSDPCSSPESMSAESALSGPVLESCEVESNEGISVGRVVNTLASASIDVLHTTVESILSGPLLESCEVESDEGISVGSVVNTLTSASIEVPRPTVESPSEAPIG